jgi:hypothetical protein
LNRNLDFIYIDSGGGHRAAATALSEVIGQQQRPWNLRLLNIQELLNSIDIVRKTTGIPFQDVYNLMLQRGWTAGTAQMLPPMHMAIRLFHREEVRVLEEHWMQARPEMVISLIPHYNRAMKEALDHVWPGTPFVTIMTDIADCPPHFWIERQDQHLICGSERAAVQARALGYPDSRILRASGMILNPSFYAPPQLDRATERERLGLRPDLPTGLVLFGGQGSVDMVKIAKLLGASGEKIQLILLCGRNQAAARELRTLSRRIPMFVEGFTREVPYYMALSDFFIGKPGPGSISEALAMQLPVIVERNARTLVQERYNTEWIEERKLGIVVRSFSRVAEAVRELLHPRQYRQYRERVAATRNFAVYEIPDMLERILATHSQFQPLPGSHLPPQPPGLGLQL